MRKMGKRSVSLLLCVTMLLGLLVPGALAAPLDETPVETAGEGEDLSNLLDFEEVTLDELTEQAANPFAATGKYEIYPTPQSITYADSTVTLPDTMQVTYGTGIDQYTKDRAVEAFREAGVTLSESASTSVKLQVSIGATGNDTKSGAYKLTVGAGGVTVVGKDTDAAFYGLTTMKRVLQQVTDKTVKCFTVVDYSDVPVRGFIEGYYGNPWTVEDREALMAFGGELKMNIYFYAPKDDPKHRNEWKALYTEEELDSLIRPLAEAGNKSKCYYGYALHPFAGNCFRFDTQAHYDEDMATLKAKFLQVIKAGVRQISLLGDDANMPNNSLDTDINSYVKVLNDLTDWVEAIRTTGVPDENGQTFVCPELRATVPFCAGFMRYADGTGNDDVLKSLAPAGTNVGKITGDVPIIMTGGGVWGSVNNNFVSTFTSNVGDGPFLWINWPCTDNSQTVLTMGAHNYILKSELTDENAAKIKGIMLNPMQQSEPSKAAIFLNADYAWNVWNGSDSQTRMDNAWKNCFKYVDHDSAIETETSTALRELSKHMIHQKGNGNNNYDESFELAPKLTAFLTKLSAGTLTAGDVSAMRGEFEVLHDAAETLSSKTADQGNIRLLGFPAEDGSYPIQHEQMGPFLACWLDFTQANLELLDALSLMLSNSDGSKDNAIVQKYLAGQSVLNASQQHGYLYFNNDSPTKSVTRYAQVGSKYIVPFTNQLMMDVATTAQTIIDPSILIENVITNRTDVSDLSALRDGDEGTKVTFTNPASLSVGDYVGVKYNRPIKLNSVCFKLGDSTADNGKNTFAACKLQYTEDGETWKDIPGTPQIVNNTMNSSWNGSCRVAEIGISGLSLDVRGVRVVSTEDVNDIWIVVREIYINDKSGNDTGDEAEIATGQLTGSVIKTTRWSVWSGPEGNLTDNNDDTTVWYKAMGNDEDNHSIVGDYLGLDFGRVVKNVGRVRIVVGNGESDDKWTNFKLQYSVDGQTWVDVKSYSSSNRKDIIEEDLGGVTARYIRFVNTVKVDKWVYFAELSAWADEGAAAARIIYQSDVVKKVQNPVAELTDDFASLAADMVMLNPKEYVGIELPRIRAVSEIVADYIPAPGLVLKVGMSEADLEIIDGDIIDTQSVQLMAADDDKTIPYGGYARYIRLENTSDQTVTTKINELSVSSEEIGGIRFLDSDFDCVYNDQDARALGTTGNWFDGDITTAATYAGAQDMGKYVLYDLGQTISVKKLTAIVSTAPAHNNYVRQGELQISMDKENWTTVVRIAKSAGAAETDGPADAGWSNYSTANFVYQSGELAQAQNARYLRLVVTGDSEYYPTINEIMINEGGYISAFGDPTFKADPIELGADFTPDKTRDGNLTTAFKPNMEGKTAGSLIYRVSENTAMGQINVLQGENEGLKIAVRAAGAADFRELGSLSGGLTSVTVPEDIADVAEIKISWGGNVTPTIYEIITVPRAEAAKAGGQAASEVETVPINSYSGNERTINFDENWKFNLGDISGAQAAVFNDSTWRTVNLPHDYSIEGKYNTANGDAESGYMIGGPAWYRKSFTITSDWQDKVVTLNFGGVYMDCEVYLNGTKLGEHHYGYTPFAYVLPDNLLKYNGENIIAVKTDDSFPSSRWYSGAGIYRSTHLTVTDPVHVARYGTKVETTNSGGVTVKTTVQNDGASAASVTVKQEIFELDGTTYEPVGAAKATLTPSAATSVAGKGSTTLTQTLNVPSPKLWNSWDKGTPNLYVLKTTVMSGSVPLDTYETEFGFRTIEFDLDDGFKLNGVNTKLKGVCQHHDQGALGSEAWYRALERQVEILMDMGCNSIRVTHNPAADELIEICNRKGILIIDEALDGWISAKNGNTHDFSTWFNREIAGDNALVGKAEGDTWAKFVVQTVVKRDMNAPCVIMYSLGNEVQQDTASGYTEGFVTAATNLITWVQDIDTRIPVTRGANDRSTDTSANNYGGRINALIAEKGGIVGFNYVSPSNIEAGHNKGWLMYASETTSHVNTRGVYDRKANANDGSKGDGLLTSYDKSHVGWGYGASDGWWRTIPYDYNMGEYIWTGFDYIGEPTPYIGTGAGVQNSSWPYSADFAAKSSYFGVIDTNGLPKDNYYLYRSMWNEKSHTLHILPTWDRDDIMIDSSGKVEVAVYSDAPMIKLYLNDTLVGEAKAVTNYSNTRLYTYRTYTGTSMAGNTFQSASGHQSLYATFMVPYAEGTLRAVACDANGNPLDWTTEGRSQVSTTTGATKLVTTADRTTIKNDGRDLSYITIDIVDSKGEIVNGAKDEITVSVSGDGVFVAMDNGVQTDHTSYQSNTWKAGAGRVVAIVQSTKKAGQFTLTATADGLTTSTVTVKTGGVDNSSNTAPASYEISKTYFVQLNTAPTLPAKATVNMGNGTKVEGTIQWNSYDSALLSQVGEFAITGTIVIPSYTIPVSVGVVVLDEVAALLNYSAATQVGQVPILPAMRPAVMADGTVVNAQFEVDWDLPEKDEDVAKLFKKEGTVVVNGTADVFGERMEVTATIRVAKARVDVLGNVADRADRLTLGEAANEGLQVIRDGNTNTAWTGSGDAIFFYNTAISLYQIKMTYQDSVPSASDAIIYISGDSNIPGAIWTELTATRTVSGKTVTYQLPNLSSAVLIKFSFAKEVALAEAEIIVGASIFSVGSTAELDGIKINGKAATDAQMDARLITTAMLTGIVTPVSNDNVAVTMLPEDAEGKIIVVTESEDHSLRDLYVIKLDAAMSDPGDASNDYPAAKTTATAPSQHGANTDASEGPASFVTDEKTSSFWHSRWSSGDNATGTAGNSQGDGDLADHPENRYIQLELEEATPLSALRYLPRQTSGNLNGSVTEYRVEVSLDGENYTAIASGEWAKSAEWKLAEFDEVVTAKYVRLYGVHTYADTGNDRFMSCAELRVVKADDRIDLSAATITVTPGEFQWKNVEIRPGSGSESDVNAEVVVSYLGETLVRGTDYVLSYENNVEPGTAYLYATAPQSSTKYQGAAATTFKIVKSEAKITSFQPYVVWVYPGVYPELAAEAWANTRDSFSQVQNRVKVPVIWPEVPEMCYIDPQIETYELTGAIEDPDMLSDPTDPNLVPKVTLNIAWSQSADTVSMVTPVGVVPTLPDKVTVQFNNGEDAQRTVTKWYVKGDAAKAALTPANFNRVGIVELEGEIEGITRVKATASVRVGESSGNEWSVGTTNIALNTDSSANIFPMALAFWSSGNNNPYQAIKGQTSASTGAGDRWSDWERGTYHTGTDRSWLGVAFSTSTQGVTRKEAQTLTLEKKHVSKVRVMFVDESGTGGAVTFPQDYEIQYYTGPVANITFDTRLSSGEDGNGNGRVRAWTGSPLLVDSNWTTITSFKAAKPAVPSANGNMLLLEFDDVETAMIRVRVTPKSEKWVGIQALEVYESVSTPIPPTAHPDFTATVTLGGTVIPKSDFTADGKGNFILEADALPENSDPTADIPVLGVTATNNAAISIKQATRVPGVPEAGAAWAQAVVTSEDGSKTETYIVKFKRTGAAEGFFIDFDPAIATSNKVTVSPKGGAAGTEITVTVARGYQLVDPWIMITDGPNAGTLITLNNGTFIMPAANVSFSASVSVIPYKITYELNGGTVERHNTTSYNVETPSFTLYNPTRGGYIFQGWVGTDLSAPTKTVKVDKGSIGDRTYIAVWTSNSSIGGGGGNNGGGGGGGTGSGNVSATTTDVATGATTVTTATPTGMVTAVTTNPDGTQTAVIQIPEKSASAVEAVMPTLNAATEPEVKIQNNTTHPVTLTIPVTGSDTVVAVRKEADGTETVIPLSIMDEDGLRLMTRPGDATIRIIDNKKGFVDVPDTHWAAGAVAFTASRELFNGMGSTITFAPASVMNRAMMTTVLWRLAEKPTALLGQVFSDVQKGSYYEEAVAWGVANGVVKGTDVGFEPDAPVTRETLAVLLYRAAGSPAVVDQMPSRVPDGGKVASWAHSAVVWCLSSGILRGREDGTIDPQAVATRAEVATMLQRYVNQQLGADKLD